MEPIYCVTFISRSVVDGNWIISPENPNTKPARRSLDLSPTNPGIASSWIEKSRKRSADRLNNLDAFLSPKK